MDLYFERHDGEAATVEQFVACFADASGRDLAQFMRWYSQAGTPEVIADGSYDAAAKTYTLDLSQIAARRRRASPVKEPMVIPLELGLVGARRRRSAAAGWLTAKRRSATSLSAGPSPSRHHRVRAVAERAGAVDQPRILGTGEADRQSVGATT